MNAQLGIIGGGQLGLYLCQAAQELGLQVTIISDTADAPALRIADRVVVGALDSDAAVEEFLANCTMVTFDKEDIPDSTLELLKRTRAQGRISVDPDPDILLMLKDKAQQKRWLQQENLPTLPFHVIADKPAFLELLADKGSDPVLQGAIVQKARRGGYDGRGVQILSAGDAAEQVWNHPSIVESFLPDCREISVITARTRSGGIQSYPPVDMEFDVELNSVKTVSMPAAISPHLATAATVLAERVVTLLNGVGVFAIEMFVTPEDEILINEISPRVHNSGHVTLDACSVSQFELHVRAVAGLPLVTIHTGMPAAMLNLLYTEDMREHCPDRPLAMKAVEDQATVYWYGKAPGTAGRKMGHINAVARSTAAAVELANNALDELRSLNSEQVA